MSTTRNMAEPPPAACDVPVGPRRRIAGLVARLHRNQDGTISIISVFAVMLLTMLLGMVMNVGRETDGKIRMQNAADAAAYSGGVTLARGMNTLVFTNHLLCDVFAVTAFMREARDGNAASYVPGVLAAWTDVAPQFSQSGFPKFQALGPAITQKVPLEQQMVDTYSAWNMAVSAEVLPLMEMILAEELIPKYQRAVALTYPEIAQMAANEIAKRNGDPDFGRGPMLGAMWRTTGLPVGGDELYNPTLPVVDPVYSGEQVYMDRARTQRRDLANRYLRDWNNEAMSAFDREGKMSQFSAFWRSFTCGQLRKLLEEEYPDSNLPFQIHRDAHKREYQDSFMFVGVVYWRQLSGILPNLFRNPVDGDAQAFAQVRLFVPRQRLVWHWHGSGGGGGGSSGTAIGGVPGEVAILPPADPSVPGGGGGGGAGRWDVGRQGVPTSWDLLNQSWTCQIVPATGPNLPVILQSMPPHPDFAAADLRLPNFGALSDDDIRSISTH